MWEMCHLGKVNGQISDTNAFSPCSGSQVRKTLDATMQTLQDMLTVEDFDVSDAFQHSQSTESVKSASSDSYMSKVSVAKRRANQQETEGFYFTVSAVTYWEQDLVVAFEIFHLVLWMAEWILWILVFTVY